jgi:anti-sigma B factor antagonist
MDTLRIESAPGNHAGIRILRLIGPFTLPTVMDFQSTFRSGDDPITLIDLSEVPYMDSAAMGALISVHTSAQRHKRLYAIAGVSERIRTLFEISGVGDILVTCPSIAAAEEMFAGKAAPK